MGRRTRDPDRAAVHHADIFPASVDPDSDLGLHLHGLVADGPLRLCLVRPWRLHGYRRLCAGAALELLERDSVAGDSARRRAFRVAGYHHRLSVLSPQGDWALFCAGDAGAEPGRPAVADR